MFFEGCTKKLSTDEMPNYFREHFLGLPKPVVPNTRIMLGRTNTVEEMALTEVSEFNRYLMAQQYPGFRLFVPRMQFMVSMTDAELIDQKPWINMSYIDRIGKKLVYVLDGEIQYSNSKYEGELMVPGEVYELNNRAPTKITAMTPTVLAYVSWWIDFDLQHYFMPFDGWGQTPARSDEQFK